MAALMIEGAVIKEQNLRCEEENKCKAISEKKEKKKEEGMWMGWGSRREVQEERKGEGNIGLKEQVNEDKKEW